MKLLHLLYNGEPVAEVYEGQFLSWNGLAVMPAEEDWEHLQPIFVEETIEILDEEDQVIGYEVTQPNPYDPPAGEYKLVAVPEVPTPTMDIYQWRANLPNLSAPQFLALLDSVEITEEQVDAVIEAIPDEEAKKIARRYWTRASFYSRVDEHIDVIGAALGLTPEAIDIAWANFTGVDTL